MNWFLKGEENILSLVNKIGQIIIVSALWLVSCLPIVTIGAATSALYYTVVKVIRKEHGYLMKEYQKAFIRNLKKGCIFTFGMIVWCIVIYLNRAYMGIEDTLKSRYFILIYNALLALTFGVGIYLYPALSRFDIKMVQLLKMSFHMALRNLPITLLLMAGTVLCIVGVWLLPIFMTLIIPGCWCYFSSMLIEKVMRLYMKKPTDDEEAWYYS